MAKKKTTKKDKIIFDYTNMMAEAVGSRHGVTEKELEKIAEDADRAFKLRNWERAEGKLPFMDLPYKKDEAEKLQDFAKIVRKNFDNYVVLGIGGSSLGTIALQSALNPIHHNLMPAERRNGPRLFVEDNVDPERIANLLEVLEPSKTLFNVITKSGGTAETMSAFLIARDMIVKKLGKRSLRNHMIATTDSKQGHLRTIVEKEGLTSFVVPDGVGGRFSVLTPVALLPAAVVGIDIIKLLDGAAMMDRRCRSGEVMKNPALLGAALQYIADTKKGKSIQVMMPYSNALYYVADWFRQLWAESLGKKSSLSGKAVYTGQTPVKALGATDQHSQVQLYNEGPNDKTITFIRVEKFRKDIKIPGGYSEIDAVSYLSGSSMSKLINSEQTATEIAVTGFNRPNSTIIIPEISESTIGQLLYMLELQTAYAGVFYDINPFDQPGVEAGKVATYALMGRPGFEKKATAIKKAEKELKRRKL